MLHMYAGQHLRMLSVSMTTYSDAYDVILTFKLRSDGKFSVGETLHGYPFLGTGSPVPSVGGAYSSAGRGGAAPNHLHWHVIALEPHLKMGEGVQVANQLHVSDLALPEEEPADWFGTAFHRRTTVVPDPSHSELLTYALALSFHLQVGGKSPAWAASSLERVARAAAGTTIPSSGTGGSRRSTPARASGWAASS